MRGLGIVGDTGEGQMFLKFNMPRDAHSHGDGIKILDCGT